MPLWNMPKERAKAVMGGQNIRFAAKPWAMLTEKQSIAKATPKSHISSVVINSLFFLLPLEQFLQVAFLPSC